MELENVVVLKIIEQYLKDNHLLQSLNILQEESGVILDSLDNIDNFRQDIVQGRWEKVLEQITLDNLDFSLVLDLYEQIYYELLLLNELPVAKLFFRTMKPFFWLQENNRDKYIHLESLLSEAKHQESSFFGMVSKEERRIKIANDLINRLDKKKPKNLVYLLHRALGMPMEQSKASPTTTNESDVLLKRDPFSIIQSINFEEDIQPSCMALSSDGRHVCVGTVDGFLEFYSVSSGLLDTSLSFQQSGGSSLVMEGCITAISFSPDSSLLASGSNDGTLTIWDLKTGILKKNFNHHHLGDILCLEFSADSMLLVSAAVDNIIKVIRFNETSASPKIFSGHTLQISRTLFLTDGFILLSCSKDGTIKVWDISSGSSLLSIIPKPSVSTATDSSVLSSPVPIFSIYPKPEAPDTEFIVCSKSNSIAIISLSGRTLDYWKVNTKSLDHFYFVSGIVIPLRKLYIALGNNHIAYIFSTESGSLIGQSSILEKGKYSADSLHLVGSKNTDTLCISSDKSRSVKLFRPSLLL